MGLKEFLVTQGREFLADRLFLLSPGVPSLLEALNQKQYFPLSQLM